MREELPEMNGLDMVREVAKCVYTVTTLKKRPRILFFPVIEIYL